MKECESKSDKEITLQPTFSPGPKASQPFTNNWSLNLIRLMQQTEDKNRCETRETSDQLDHLPALNSEIFIAAANKSGTTKSAKA